MTSASSSRPVLLVPALWLTEHLRTRTRLLTLVTLLVVPALLATWSFWSVISSQVAFAEAERSGVTVVRPAMTALAQTAAGDVADLGALRAAVARHPELGADEALDAVLDAAASGDGPAERAATATALAALVATVGDSSNLILDPDLDSFYLMDALVVQLPRALVTAGADVDADAPVAERVAARAVQAGALAGAADAIRSDVDKAVRSTERAGLQQALADTVTAAEALSALAGTVTGDLGRPGREEASARSAAAEAGDAAARSLAGELDALLAARADAMSTRRDVTLALTLAGLALACWFAAAVVWRTRRDVQLTVEGAVAIGDGDLHARPLPSGPDELGDIGRAVSGARERLQRLLAAIGADTAVLRDACAALATVSTELRADAERSATEAGTVASGATQVSESVHTVSAGTAEMAAAVREIAGSASAAATVTAEAVAMAELANDSVSKLDSSSGQISGVLALIGSIAGQTNLLALNATIEAARAGEYGKGFAVVATEVKELAQQTAAATEEVGRKVAQIQSDAGGAVEALSRMNAIIGRISDHSATIAAAVEEQTATTSEMTRNLAGAAVGSQSIADTVATVAEAADRTTAGAARTEDAADAVRQVSRRLDTALSDFAF